jgi:hypothetical protein
MSKFEWEGAITQQTEWDALMDLHIVWISKAVICSLNVLDYRTEYQWGCVMIILSVQSALNEETDEHNIDVILNRMLNPRPWCQRVSQKLEVVSFAIPANHDRWLCRNRPTPYKWEEWLVIPLNISYVCIIPLGRPSRVHQVLSSFYIPWPQCSATFISFLWREVVVGEPLALGGVSGEGVCLPADSNLVDKFFHWDAAPQG